MADVGLELLPDGRPAYREVIFYVPRQSGKTTMILCWELQRALGWAEILKDRQRLVYSAQTGKDARIKLLQDQWDLIEPHRKALDIRKVIRTNGAESVEWRNGSRLGLLASGEDSGHGLTIDLAVKDELWKDVDFRRDQAMGPAMITRPFAQSLTASTAGTNESLALIDSVERGRAAVEDDRSTGVAFFEWSAEPEDDPGDPSTWWRCMPALGRTTMLELIEGEYARMPLEEFKRAYLNIPTASDDRVISAAAWQSVCSPEVEAEAGLFAFDVNPERTAAGIVAVGEGPILEVVDYRPGVGWIPDRLEELQSRYRVPFAVDRRGPAASLIEELDRRQLSLVEIDSTKFPRACGLLFDAVTETKIKVRTNRDLDAAVAGASKRPVGDAWVWGRTSRVDISLLVAATIGLWAFENPATKVSPRFAFV